MACGIRMVCFVGSEPGVVYYVRCVGELGPVVERLYSVGTLAMMG